MSGQIAPAVRAVIGGILGGCGDRLTLLELIGQGASGQVYRGARTHITNTMRAHWARCLQPRLDGVPSDACAAACSCMSACMHAFLVVCAPKA
eukprot:105602-Pelagomonas_calceolata.AAC.2